MTSKNWNVLGMTLFVAAVLLPLVMWACSATQAQSTLGKTEPVLDTGAAVSAVVPYTGPLAPLILALSEEVHQMHNNVDAYIAKNPEKKDEKMNPLQLITMLLTGGGALASLKANSTANAVKGQNAELHDKVDALHAKLADAGPPTDVAGSGA